MSVLLVASSIVTTMLIPPAQFAEGGEAYGRALAYIAHEHLGEVFGTVYDISTVAILWFAGASAMVGLLNLVPRYLPRYGMAPEWAKAHRPLVVIFTAVTFIVTMLFKADVTSQGGAYATGVLVLMGSAALAVTLADWREHRSWIGYLAAHGGVRLHHGGQHRRAARRREDRLLVHRHDHRDVDDLAGDALDRAARPRRRAGRPGAALHPRGGVARRSGSSPTAPTPDCPTSTSTSCARRASRITCRGNAVLFLEVRPGDVSEFSGTLRVHGVDVAGHHVLRCVSAAIPNAIAALLLYIRDETGRVPHAYFGWTEGNPIAYLLKFLAFGEGDTAPVTREVLRQTEAGSPAPAAYSRGIAALRRLLAQSGFARRGRRP